LVHAAAGSACGVCCPAVGVGVDGATEGGSDGSKILETFDRLDDFAGDIAL